ncbi:MAG: murein biosynthesis integral membrane protein MurJ [Pseudoclavibacter sp.]
MTSTGIGRSSAVIATGTLTSRALGFVKAVVLAATLGAVGSKSADAFQNAALLPNSIYAVLAGGAMTAILIPQVVRASQHADGGQKFVNRLVTLGLCALATLTVIATLSVPALSALYGISLDADQRALVVAIGYWCMPQVFFYGLYAILGEVLNARGLFGPFAWAPAMNNVIAITGLVVFSALFGPDPDGKRLVGDWTPEMVAVLGGTATLGVAAQGVVLFAFWPRVGLAFRPSFRWRGTGLARVGKLASWTFGILLISQAAGVVETIVLNVASGSGPSTAAFSIAFLIFALPHAIIAVSIGSAYFTRMSVAASLGRFGPYVNDFSASVRLVGLFTVLACFGVIVIAPACARVFEASPQGVAPLAALIVCFTVGLVPFCGLFLVQRALYAVGVVSAQFWVFLATLPLHVFCMAVSAIQPTERIAAGLALSQGLVTIVRLGVLLLLLRRHVGRIHLRRIAGAYVTFTVAGACAAPSGVAAAWLLGVYDPSGYARAGILPALAACVVVATVMSCTYVTLLALLRSRELSTLWVHLRTARGR